MPAAGSGRLKGGLQPRLAATQNQTDPLPTLPQAQPLLKVLPHTSGKRVPFNVGHGAVLIRVLHAEDRLLDLLPLPVRLVFIRFALKFVEIRSTNASADSSMETICSLFRFSNASLSLRLPKDRTASMTESTGIAVFFKVAHL
jgi:hypothetical protein